MNTCKAAWLVLRANIFQLLVYLLATVVMAALLGIGVGENAGSGDQTNTYDPPTATLAIIDRDSAGAHATGAALRSYLSATADIVEVTDDTQAIQDAIATQYVNLIVIVPQGYADSFTRAAHDGGTLPSLGLAGASGSESTDSASVQMLTLNINGFLGSLRSVMLADDTANLSQAAAKVVNASADNGIASHTSIRVEQASGTTPTLPASARVCASTFAIMLYPLMLSIAFIVIVIINAFNQPTTMRRVSVSATPGRSIWTQVLLVCCLASILIWLCCTAVTLICASTCQGGITGIGTRPLLLTLCGTFVFSLMVASLGFFIGQLRMSSAAMNGIVNTVALASAFLSGAWLPQWLMPASLRTFARLLPGWWYVGGVYDAFGGQGAAMSGVPDMGRWAGSTGLMALYAIAFIAAGFVVSRFVSRRS